VGGIAYCCALEPGFSRKKGREGALDVIRKNLHDDGNSLPRCFILPALSSRKENRRAVFQWFFRRMDSYSYAFVRWIRDEESPLEEGKNYPEVDILMGCLDMRLFNENKEGFHLELK
jgi:hypothetical protein